MKDKLIDLITIGIARACVKEASGEQVDKAEIIADILIENNYRKSSEIAREIIFEVKSLFKTHRIEFDMSCIDTDFDKGLRKIEKKYTEEIK
jgi:hypothetical protein